MLSCHRTVKNVTPAPPALIVRKPLSGAVIELDATVVPIFAYSGKIS